MPNNSGTGGYLSPENGTPTLDVDDPFDTVLQTMMVGITSLPPALVRPRWQLAPPPEPEVGVNWVAVGVIEEDAWGGRGFVTHVGSEDPETDNLVTDSQADNVSDSLATQVTTNASLITGAGADFVQIVDEARCLASFYGPNARGYAQLFRLGLMAAQNREPLTLLNMQLVGMPGPSRFVPAIVSMQTQRRVDIEFVIRRANVAEFPVRNLRAVRVDLTFKPGGSGSETFLFELP